MEESEGKWATKEGEGRIGRAVKGAAEQGVVEEGERVEMTFGDNVKEGGL